MAVPPVLSRTWLAPRTLPTGADEAGGPPFKVLRGLGQPLYVVGDTYTNTVEGFFGHLKPSIRGTYRKVSRRWLQGYLNEFTWRYNLRWDHIVKGHPAMEGLEMAVKRTLENADEIGRGNGPNIAIIYGRNLGPARWLAVVVAYEEHNAGFILTAYPQNKDPKASERGKERPTEAES